MLYLRKALVLATLAVASAQQAVFVVTGGSCADIALEAIFQGAIGIAVPGAMTCGITTASMTTTTDGTTRTVAVTVPAASGACTATAASIATYYGAGTPQNVALLATLGVSCSGVTAVSTCTSTTTPAACSAGGGAANPCFPSNALVTKADGSPTRIDSLKEGDSLLAMTTDGKLMTDTVSLLSIAEPSKAADFVSLTTDAGAKLNLTAGHHIATGATCCSNLKVAKDVTVGETVWVMANRHPLPVAQKIVSKGSVHETGLHSPVLTHGGLPIVGGFVTAFDSLEAVKAASTGLAAMLQLCKASGTCDTVKSAFRAIDNLRAH